MGCTFFPTRVGPSHVSFDPLTRNSHQVNAWHRFKHADLEHIQDELMSLVISRAIRNGIAVEMTSLRIIVVPGFVVDRNSHLGRITVVHAVITAVVLASPIVLRVINIGIVIVPFPVTEFVVSAPDSTVSILISRGGTCEDA